MAPDDEELDALLETVANHGRVDWEKAELRAESGEERSRVRGLRDVARVADFHRTLHQGVSPGMARLEVETWGELLLLERVGSGASADVYRAWDPALQREVALKLLRARPAGGPEARDWLEEARALARVRDAHVVSVYGAAEHDERAGLWMEFLRGPTLEDVMTRRGALPAAEVTRLGVELARALVAVHAAGALHRDLKPANVIVADEGRAVLTDFGLGRRGSSERDAEPFSGTPMFMSPRRLTGAPAQATDDVYALGVTLWWALAGKPPFRAGTIDELRAAAAAGPGRSLSAERPDAPAALVAAIERAMKPDAAERFAGASDMAAAFERAGSGGIEAEHASPRWMVWAVVLALAGVAGWFALARMRPRPAPSQTSTPATLAGAYDVSARFLRRTSSGNEPLDTGDRVAPGDRVSLEFRSSHPLWVYVLDADDRGECYLLFPQPLFDRHNPIAHDATTVLPGTIRGDEVAWTVTSRGGREHLLVVANAEPVAELEAQLAQLPAPVPGHPINYARVAPAAMGRLRGMAGLSSAPAPPSAPGTPGTAEIFERMRALAGAEQGVHGTWVRQVTLENPLH